MNGIHATQRAMRRMRRQAIDRGTVALLDVGTSKIACLILRFDGPDHFAPAEGIGPLAGQSTFRVVGAAATRARGVSFGEISAMAETERAIRTALQAAQKMAGLRADHAIACFAGAHPCSHGLTGGIDLEDGIVGEGHVAQALAGCTLPDLAPGAEVLHAQPVNFALDHRSGLTDPRGQIGNRLSADIHLLTVEGDRVRTLAHCLKRCDMEPAGLAASAYTAGLASLVEDERELGAACIDMGGGTTTLSIFLRKHMIYAETLRLGGEHVTRDISQGLQIPFATAERLKTFHGGVVATGMDDREMIELGGETGDFERDRRRVSRADLIAIIRPRVEEILEEVRTRLDAAGFEALPSRQIVLTGGASQVPGLDRLGGRILGQQLRLGRPLRVQGLPQATSGPAFSAAVGLALFAAHPQDEWWDFDLPATAGRSRPLRHALRWFRENW